MAGIVVLKNIWLNPPLAFARLGSSANPCDAYHWSESDLRPGGTGTTTLKPALTIDLSEKDGTPTGRVPKEIVFSDADGIRPVCPYYELHATWTVDGGAKSGPLTKAVLKSLGLKLADLTWSVHMANAKAFHYTYEPGDRVEARLEIAGGDTKKHALEAASMAGVARPMLLAGKTLAMGAVQLAKPNAKFPEVRLRIHAPKGRIYGPAGMAARLAALETTPGDFKQNGKWAGFALPDDALIVDPTSSWATYTQADSKLPPFAGNDYRNAPGGLLATVIEPDAAGVPVERSLGLMDDTSDGIITCRLTSGGATFEAQARVTVGPPDFAPATRQPVSVADNLADREDRATPRKPDALSPEELREIVADIFERALETSSSLNKDYVNLRSTRNNRSTVRALGASNQMDRSDVEELLWPLIDREAVLNGRSSAFPLSETGLRRHRRLAAIEYIEDRFREDPTIVERWIRPPREASPFFDKRMPPLMAGSDGRPFHLTRRQWEIIHLWVASLRTNTSQGANSGANT